jgi:squalene-hopene/tetraprenyl-beta-curcumene cyclase
VESADRRARRWLDRVQRADGAWVPLWFGNEREANQDNPVYGTGRVVAAHRSGRGVAYLNRAQNADGGWGGGVGLESSIEETAIAMGGLGGSECGAAWLAQATKAGEHTPPSPIGLYFARLWYYEELYPLIFSTGALAGSRPQS